MAVASPLLALLDEPDNSLKEYALKSLNDKVGEIWPEIADRIPQIEELYEDPGFPAQSLAALVASKVYYNLGDLDESVQFALAAGTALDLTTRSEYIDTIIAHSLKTYIRQRQREVDDENSSNGATGEAVNGRAVVETDKRLTAIVEQMLDRCVANGQVTLALGIALEARRLDIVESFLKTNGDEETLTFVFDACVRLLNNRSFKNRVLRSLERILSTTPEQHYVLLTKVVVQLDDPEVAVKMLERIDDALAAQVAFDLVATASQELLGKTSATFCKSSRQRDARLVKILSGVPTGDLEVTFLERNNHTDLAVLERSKAALDARNSMFHSALTFQNAFLHAGTTEDSFFRHNADWVTKATHWTRFVATAGLGVIHRGNLSQGRRILKPYLPGSRSGSMHSRAGALYGLGLIFAGFGNGGQGALGYLKSQLQPQDWDSDEEGDGAESEEGEVRAHGACLGIGLAALRTQDQELYAKLREVLFTDSAIAGEAAGLAMGLVMLGSKNDAAEQEMLQYAHETQHEKIIRSLALGIALLNYGKEEAADSIVDNLLGDQEPILRYGGCFTLALAYAGTGNNRTISRLLHMAVADSSDDVRRAAVTSLGFILLRNPQALPRMVELLSESHNPHVRYGTAMALGIACAGTGLTQAVDVLDPMIKDPVDFVRQGSMIALAMILVQRTDSRAKSLRDHFAKVIKTKNEDALAKFGAAVAQGIIDSGGCNATITIENKQTGNLNMKAVAGLFVFLQYWYWFPLAHFMSLSFTPTTVVGVRASDLRPPEFSMECAAPASRFGYPPKMEEPGNKAPEKLVTAILSTTVKQRRKRNKAGLEPDLAPVSASERPKGAIAKDTTKVEPKDGTKGSTKDSAPKEKDGKDSKEQQQVNDNKEKEKDGEKEDEPIEFELPNMSRVVPWQRRFVHTVSSSRYQPVGKRAEPSGVVVLTDNQPDDEAKLILTQRQRLVKEDEFDEAPKPPPFYLAPQ